MNQYFVSSFLKKALTQSLIILSLAACGGGGGGNDSGATVQPTNKAPIAVAGDEQTVDEETSVILKGSATDVDGTIASYAWSVTSGQGIILSDPSITSPSFEAPTTSKMLTLSFQLTVTDNDGASSSDTVNIIINPVNTIPVADAGADQTVVINDIIILDGNKSSDPDGTNLSFNWSVVSTPTNSTTSLDDNTSGSPSFTADSIGEYVLELIVNDGETDSIADSITITAIAPNTLPVADAGEDLVLILGNDAVLDGSKSSDADNQDLSFSWSLVSKPVNSIAEIYEPSIESPLFSPDISGDYVIALVVNDGSDDSVKDEMTVTAGTGVGGIISVDTIWSVENSPYILANKIQTAYGITLQVNSGVRVIGNDLDIEVFGSLDVNGSEEGKVVLSNVNIVPGDNPIDEWFDINIDHAIADDGSIYSPTGNAIYGSLSLRNSIISSQRYMYIWYPVKDCLIEKNIFINSGGIDTGHRDDIKVFIRNNVFYQSTGSISTEFSVKNWASYGESETVVEFNSFLSTDRIAVAVHIDGAMSAENNFWNTLDSEIIESMINDVNDDLSLPDEISYDFLLSKPHTNTPDPTPYLPQ